MSDPTTPPSDLGFSPDEEQLRIAYWHFIYEHGTNLDRRQVDAEFDRGMAKIKAQVRAEALEDYAKNRYLAYLEHPEKDWLEQPEGTARHYAKVAADLLAEAARIRALKGETK